MVPHSFTRVDKGFHMDPSMLQGARSARGLGRSKMICLAIANATVRHSHDQRYASSGVCARTPNRLMHVLEVLISTLEVQVYIAP